MNSGGFTAKEEMLMILMAILLFACYLAVLRRLQSAAEGRNIAAAAVILLIIFACAGVGLVYAAEIMGGMENMVLAVLMGFSVFSVAWLARQLSLDFSGVNRGAVVLFLGYVVVILCGTVFFRTGNSDTTIQTNAFSAIKSAADGDGGYMLNHMILNVLLFVPYGLLFALALPQLHSVLYGLMAGIVFSVFAETMQLVMKAGQCDLDDILANTFGTVAGYAAYRLIWRRWKGEEEDDDETYD